MCLTKHVQNICFLVTHFDCLSLVPLFSIGVHAPREVPGLAIDLLRLLLVFLQCSLVHHVRQVHDLPANGRFACFEKKGHLDGQLFHRPWSVHLHQHGQ